MSFPHSLNSLHSRDLGDASRQPRRRSSDATVAACTPATLEMLAATLAPAASALFFVEARFLAGSTSSAVTGDLLGDAVREALAPQLVSQFGIAVHPVDEFGVSVFSRTGGVLLIAGVGSYYAYRLGRRLLAGCAASPWTLFESTRCDLLARADSRLLHPASEGFYEVRIGEDGLEQIQKLLDAAGNVGSSRRGSSTGLDANGHGCGALIRKIAEDVASRRREDGGLAAICSDDDFTADNLPLPRQNADDAVLDTLQLFSSLPSTSAADVSPSPSSCARRRHTPPNIYNRVLYAAVQSPGKRRGRFRGDDDDSRSVLSCSHDYYGGASDEDDDCISISGRSELTSVSRMRDGVALRIARQQEEQRRRRSRLRQSADDADNRLATAVSAGGQASAIGADTSASSDLACDAASETASTSLRLAWQGEPYWDNEFEEDYYYGAADRASPTPSGISDLSAVRNLEAIFQDHDRRDASIAHRMSLGLIKSRRATQIASAHCTKSVHGTPRRGPMTTTTMMMMARAGDDVGATSSEAAFSTTSAALSQRTRNDDAMSAVSSRWDDEILARCLNDDVGYMYHSTLVDARGYEDDQRRAGRGDSISGASNLSAVRYASLRFRDSASPSGRYTSEGLWELTSTASRVSSSSASISREMLEKHDQRASPGVENAASIVRRTDADVGRRRRDRDTMRSDAGSLASATQQQPLPAGISDSCFSKSSSCGSSSICSSSLPSACSRKMTTVARPEEENNRDQLNEAVMFDSAIAMTESMSSTAAASLASTSGGAFPSAAKSDATPKHILREAENKPVNAGTAALLRPTGRDEGP